MPVRIIVVILFILLPVLSCHQPAGRLNVIQHLSHYPSGSGLAYLDKRFYVIGDDASYLLITDIQLNPVDSIVINASTDHRIAKEVKPDTEAIAVLTKTSHPQLLIIGSGSLSPHRDSCVLVDPVTREKKYYSLAVFYRKLKEAGIRDLNIEGATALPGGIALVSRGNKGFPQNNLIITSDRFWENQETVKIKLIKTGFSADTAFFNGISGMDYSNTTDRLLLTVSTEDTRNSYDDGVIGKSYLWIINNISSKKEYEGINPDKVIDLEEMDPRFKGQKIESVCIVSESKDRLELLLVADDDKGGTTLFKIGL